MRYYPNVDVDYEKEELDMLKPKDWQLEQLKLNPEYLSWGNYEDYMTSHSQWGSPIELNCFSEAWSLDELNELINFYFMIEKNDDDSECKLKLQMWFIHPRKGASRGVIINEIKQEELSDVYKYLREAKERNLDRFSKIPKECE